MARHARPTEWQHNTDWTRRRAPQVHVHRFQWAAHPNSSTASRPSVLHFRMLRSTLHVCLNNVRGATRGQQRKGSTARAASRGQHREGASRGQHREGSNASLREETQARTAMPSLELPRRLRSSRPSVVPCPVFSTRAERP